MVRGQPQDGSANNYPVNKVTFQGFSDLPGQFAGSTFDNGYNGFGSPNTSDANYNTLLQYARFSNEGTTPATFGWSGMIPGDTYLVEFWVNDGRSIGQARSETITKAGPILPAVFELWVGRKRTGTIYYWDICRRRHRLADADFDALFIRIKPGSADQSPSGARYYSNAERDMASSGYDLGHI